MRIAIASGLGLLLFACNPDGKTFQCGVQINSTASDYQTCTRAHEACVCATNKCATIDSSCADAGDLRYVEYPFGQDKHGDDRGACVGETDAKTAVSGTQACATNTAEDAGATQ